LSTAVCMAEMLSWEELTSEQRGLAGLGGMYGGYLALGKFVSFSFGDLMGVRGVWCATVLTNDDRDFHDVGLLCEVG
jgi:hypothetical protein